MVRHSDCEARLRFFAAALRLPVWWIPKHWLPVLTDDFLQLCGRLRPVQLSFTNVVLRVHPTLLVCQVGSLLRGLGLANAFSLMNCQVPIGFFGHHQFRLELTVPETRETTVIIGIWSSGR